MTTEMIKGISNKELIKLALIGLCNKMNDARVEIEHGKKCNYQSQVEHYTGKLAYLQNQAKILGDVLNTINGTKIDYSIL